MQPSWTSDLQTDLRHFKFAKLGKNVKISGNAIIFGAENIIIGDNVRIDAGCVLAASGRGWLTIGNNVHLAPGSIFQCGGGIEIQDHAQVAAGCRLVSSSDDLSGEHLVGPCVPDEFRKIWNGRILIEKFAIIGVGAILLPLCHIKEGAVVGAGSLVKAHQVVEDWTIVYGNPAVARKTRSRKILELAEAYRVQQTQAT